MKHPQIFIRDLPRYETMRALVERYPTIDLRTLTCYVVLVRVTGEILAHLDRKLGKTKLSRGRLTALALLNRAPDPPQLKSPNPSNPNGARNPRNPRNSRPPSKPATPRPYEHSPFELARKSGVTRATMTGLLDGLEREGLVTRARSDTDRRMQIVRLTPRGRKLIESVIPVYYREIGRLLHGISTGEKKKFLGMLTKIGMTLPGFPKIQ